MLIIDKVYTAQQIEYCNGQFIGLIKDGIASKAVLTFMVQSIYGRYKDVVCLIPINKLDTALLREWFFKVMEGINDRFQVLLFSADNHVCTGKVILGFLFELYSCASKCFSAYCYVLAVYNPCNTSIHQDNKLKTLKLIRGILFK